MEPAREWCPMLLGSVHRRRAAARAWPATAMNATTCPTNPDVGSSQMSMCFVWVAPPEMGSFERVQLVKPARAVGEARRSINTATLQATPMPTDPMSSFFVRITDLGVDGGFNVQAISSIRTSKILLISNNGAMLPRSTSDKPERVRQRGEK